MSEVEIEGRRLRLSNLDKVLYPEAGFTKAQVIDYYARIGDVMLPHLADRALTLVPRLEGPPPRRPAAYGHDRRRYEGVRARGGSAPRQARAGSSDGDHAARRAQRKGVRRLEPERPAQDHHLRLLVAREAATAGVDPG